MKLLRLLCNTFYLSFITMTQELDFKTAFLALVDTDRLPALSQGEHAAHVAFVNDGVYLSYEDPRSGLFYHRYLGLGRVIRLRDEADTGPGETMTAAECARWEVRFVVTQASCMDILSFKAQHPEFNRKVLVHS